MSNIMLVKWSNDNWWLIRMISEGWSARPFSSLVFEEEKLWNTKNYFRMCRPWLGRLPFSLVLFAISNQPSGSVPIIVLITIWLIIVMMVVLEIIMITITLNFHGSASNMNKSEGQIIQSLDKSFLIKEVFLEKELRKEVEGGEISSKQPKPEMRPRSKLQTWCWKAILSE